jgi:hypothetical protein
VNARTTPSYVATAILVMLCSGQAWAQGGISNGKIETRAVAQDLDREIQALAADDVARWIGYRVPMVGGPRRMCCFESPTHAGDCCGQCRLERGDGIVMTQGDQLGPSATRIVVEPPTDMLVLVRVESRAVVRLRTFSLDCRIDAGGMPVVWLENVRVDDSVAWLANVSRASVVGPNVGPSLSSGALDQPPITALALHPGPAALTTLIGFARDDPRPRVRGHALFWLAQRAGEAAVAAIGASIEHDSELEVKKRAVFALSQMPKAEGVPLLMDVARTHRHTEVRRQAMFWLGQSKDPRAVSFFEEILRAR